ncbi:hypothetical protein [Ferrovibrio terrae]|uniref:hypothetical protein n=1 Tax=Ferrovibrio terrae TaxID=2594003 RepID=UPI0031379032
MSNRPAVIRETMTAGIYQRAMLDSTAIDVAQRAGWLGEADSDESKWRIEAALWLRRTYERAGLRQRESGSYQTRSEGSPEMSDVEAWNQKVFTDAARVIGTANWPAMRQFVIDDHQPPPPARQVICHQLDRLACHRGMVSQDHPRYHSLAATLRAEGVSSWR